MKHILTLAFLSALLISASSFNFGNDSDTPGKNKRIEVVFNPGSTIESLTRIRKTLAAKGIILKFQDLKFNKDGNLTAIHFSVDCGDGFSGSAGTDMVSYGVRFGFFRDYAEDAAVPFGAGGF